MSERGLALTRTSEGLRLAAYRDGAGLPTLGYGHTASVRMGDTCSEEQARQWLRQDLALAEAAVSRLARVELQQGQFDALVDFAFNLGAGALGGSSLLHKLNDGDHSGAAAEFPRWVHDAAGHVEPGLVTRRGRERLLFETGNWK
jgi:lysozyme